MNDQNQMPKHPKDKKNNKSFDEIVEFDELFQEIAKVDETPPNIINEIESKKKIEEEIVESDELEVLTTGDDENIGDKIKRELGQASDSEIDIITEDDIIDLDDNSKIDELFDDETYLDDFEQEADEMLDNIMNHFEEADDSAEIPQILIDEPSEQIITDEPNQDSEEIIVSKKQRDKKDSQRIRKLKEQAQQEIFTQLDTKPKKDDSVKIDELSEQTDSEEIVISKKQRDEKDSQRIKKLKEQAQQEIFTRLDAKPKKDDSSKIDELSEQTDSEEIVISKKQRDEKDSQRIKKLREQAQQEIFIRLDAKPKKAGKIQEVAQSDNDNLGESEESPNFEILPEKVEAFATMPSLDSFDTSYDETFNDEITEQSDSQTSEKVEYEIQAQTEQLEAETQNGRYPESDQETQENKDVMDYLLTPPVYEQEQISVGEILELEGVVTEEELTNKLDDPELVKSPVFQVLANSGMPKQSDLWSFLSQNYVMPKIDLKGVKIDKEALAVVPEELAKKFNILPLLRIGNVICIATSEFYDKPALEELRSVTGLKIKFLFAPSEKILKALDIVYNLVAHPNAQKDNTKIAPENKSVVNKQNPETKHFEEKDISTLDELPAETKNINTKTQDEAIHKQPLHTPVGMIAEQAMSSQVPDSISVEEIQGDELEPEVDEYKSSQIVEKQPEKHQSEEIITSAKKLPEISKPKEEPPATTETQPKKLRKKPNPLEVLGLSVDIDKTLTDEEIEKKMASEQPKTLIGSIPSEATSPFASEVIGSISDNKFTQSVKNEAPESITQMSDEEKKKANIERLKLEERKLEDSKELEFSAPSDVKKANSPIVSDVNIPTFRFGSPQLPTDEDFQDAEAIKHKNKETARKKITKVKRRITSALTDSNPAKPVTKRLSESFKQNFDIESSMDSDKGDNLLFLQADENESEIHTENQKISEELQDNTNDANNPIQ